MKNDQNLASIRPQQRTFSEFVQGVKQTRTEYTDEGLRQYWLEAQEETIKRGSDCAVIPCDPVEALILSRNFIRMISDPTRTHYNGNTLSLYCGRMDDPETEEHYRQVVLSWRISRCA